MLENPQLIERLQDDELRVIALDRDFGPACSGVHVDRFHGAMQAARFEFAPGSDKIVCERPYSLASAKLRALGLANDGMRATALGAPIDIRLPLDRVAEAVALMRGNAHFGKIVLTQGAP